MEKLYKNFKEEIWIKGQILLLMECDVRMAAANFIQGKFLQSLMCA